MEQYTTNAFTKSGAWLGESQAVSPLQCNQVLQHFSSRSPCLPDLAMQGMLWPTTWKSHSFIHSTPSNPQIRCVAADIPRQPSSLPCLGISSFM